MDGPRAGQAQQDAIGPAHVVGDEHDAAAVGKVLHALDADPIDQPRQQPDGEADGLRGQRGH